MKLELSVDRTQGRATAKDDQQLLGAVVEVVTDALRSRVELPDRSAELVAVLAPLDPAADAAAAIVEKPLPHVVAVVVAHAILSSGA